MKVFNYTIILIVAASIIAGFFVLGTPKEERMRRFDETRVSNLQDIQWQVINYWQAKSELPKDLSQLINQTQGVRPPVDPETGAAYEYKILDAKKLTFELCADFKTLSSDKVDSTTKPRSVYEAEPYPPPPIVGDINWNWQHGVGRTCFERTIDPDLYKTVLEKNID